MTWGLNKWTIILMNTSLGDNMSLPNSRGHSNSYFMANNYYYYVNCVNLIRPLAYLWGVSSHLRGRLWCTVQITGYRWSQPNSYFIHYIYIQTYILRYIASHQCNFCQHFQNQALFRLDTHYPMFPTNDYPCFPQSFRSRSLVENGCRRKWQIVGLV